MLRGWERRKFISSAQNYTRGLLWYRFTVELECWFLEGWGKSAQILLKQPGCFAEKIYSGRTKYASEKGEYWWITQSRLLTRDCLTKISDLKIHMSVSEIRRNFCQPVNFHKLFPQHPQNIRLTDRKIFLQKKLRFQLGGFSSKSLTPMTKFDLFLQHPHYNQLFPLQPANSNCSPNQLLNVFLWRLNDKKIKQKYWFHQLSYVPSPMKHPTLDWQSFQTLGSYTRGWVASCSHPSIAH